MKTLALLALLLLPASFALAQAIGEDDGPIGGPMVGGGDVGNGPIGGPMVGGGDVGNAPIGGAVVDGAAVGQEEDDAAVGNQPLY